MTDHRTERVRAAYAECGRLARRHYENFPVVSYLVPRPQRDALAAIYAFARAADDFADEPGEAHRLESLAEWRQRLAGCYAEGPLRSDAQRGLERADLVFLALGHAVREFRLSQDNLENLLCAFEQDVRVNRCPNFPSLLEYCRCSANPVGRLVLELFGHREPELVALSDAICTALQLTNFWQDVRVDLERDRVYLPLDDLTRFNLTVADLEAWLPPAPSGNGRDAGPDERWQKLMAFEVARTRQLFEQGRPLPEKVGPELRRQLRLTWLGGTAILDKIESARYDVFRRRFTLGRRDFLRLYLRARRAPAGGAVSSAGSIV
ncbi:MAG TPA: squalene synthase HpnC [Terriglobia bacterium]|nr:squalene synthase HpnC [Terriglobia bacterium]